MLKGGNKEPFDLVLWFFLSFDDVWGEDVYGNFVGY